MQRGSLTFDKNKMTHPAILYKNNINNKFNTSVKTDNVLVSQSGMQNKENKRTGLVTS